MSGSFAPTRCTVELGLGVRGIRVFGGSGHGADIRFCSKIRTPDMGGSNTTHDFTRAVLDTMGEI